MGLEHLSERPPDVRAAAPEAPPAFAMLVRRMLARDPDDRPMDAGAVLRGLDASGLMDDDLDEPAAPGRAERRLVSFVLGEVSPSALAEQETAPGDGSEVLAKARRAVEANGATLQTLANRAVLVTVERGAGATDQAGPAAECALALRRIWPELRLAVASGRTAASSPVGEVIDVAAEMLRSAVDGRIAVDDVTAGLLAGRFEVEEREGRRWLVGRAGVLHAGTNGI